jgi:hypothetical protein
MNKPIFKSVWYVPVLLFAPWLAGCATAPYDRDTLYANPDRASKGLVVILPGIEGEDRANHDIRQGLYDAKIPYALVIYRWGTPLPGLGLLINQTDVARNRRQAQEMASQLAMYQTKHPGVPIFLIGHSAGGGLAVFTLEALGRIPGAKPIDGAFLLSSSLSADYDLTDALGMTRLGLVNVSNIDDGLLDKGTATFGNVDGGHGDSAGRVGFTRTYPKVFERPITNEQARRDLGVTDIPHFVATHEQLIGKYAPAWILIDAWPPPAWMEEPR